MITAQRMGIAAAFNGEDANLTGVRHLDGSVDGVQRFLAERKAAEDAATAERDRLDAAFTRAQTAKVDPADLAAMQAHTDELEQGLRAQITASGGDAAELDKVIETAGETPDIAEKAYKAISMCMLRSA
jgi:hypothetical protein